MSIAGLFDEPRDMGRAKTRDRSREGAGKSERSYIKHGLVRRAVGAQLAAYRTHNKGRIVLIDGNAGDGHGVEQPQADLFGDNPSCATAEMLVEFAAKDGNADVVLCEAHDEKRSELARRFPQATILANHSNAPEAIRPGHQYGLWLSDPCGPAHHGVAYMRAVADRVKSDFVVVFNEGWISSRLLNTKDDRWATSRRLYGPMVAPEWWAHALNRRGLARNNSIVNGAPNFRYRVLIVANHLSQGAMRKPFEVVQCV